jgi:hypothetical protein
MKYTCHMNMLQVVLLTNAGVVQQSPIRFYKDQFCKQADVCSTGIKSHNSVLLSVYQGSSPAYAKGHLQDHTLVQMSGCAASLLRT